MSRLILASASPRRRELLSAHGAHFTVLPTDTDEHCPQGMCAAELVRYLALKKGEACLKAGHFAPDDLILAADTVVEAPSGKIMGKPIDDADAFRMLRSLSGTTHRVWSGIALLTGDGSRKLADCEETSIVFRTLSDNEINAYIATGEPRDKAGSYAIQGGGKAFVASIDGDFENVVGLPTNLLTRRLAADFGKKLTDFVLE